MHEAAERVGSIIDGLEADKAQLTNRVAELEDAARVAQEDAARRSQPVSEEKQPLTGDPQSRIEALEDENDRLRGQAALQGDDAGTSALDALRTAAGSLGIEVDTRWREKRLLDEIAAVGKAAGLEPAAAKAAAK